MISYAVIGTNTFLILTTELVISSFREGFSFTDQRGQLALNQLSQVMSFHSGVVPLLSCRCGEHNPQLPNTQSKYAQPNITKTEKQVQHRSFHWKLEKLDRGFTF